MIKRIFTSESVTEGHPDKMCDQISDAILDAILGKDKNARVACEVAVATGLVMVMGEITTDCYIDIPKTVRNTIKEIGYDRAKYGFDCHTCSVILSINEQSPDIKVGVDKKGAGDQGMMFGFACDETPELMPLPIVLAHKLAAQLAKVRKTGVLPYLRPDGKTQVSIEYDRNGVPVLADTIVISAQHSSSVERQQIDNDLRQFVIAPVVDPKFLADTKIFVNPTGKFVVGGPSGDCGLTGRKIIVDTYGGYARHGGGAFSGKDPTKVDRSGCYAARYVAKNIVAAGLAKKCEVQLAYAIGVDRPVSVLIDAFGTETIPVSQIYERVEKYFDLTPFGIIDMLDLKRPIYRKTAAYGHFGRTDAALPWELTDKADLLKQ